MKPAFPCAGRVSASEEDVPVELWPERIVQWPNKPGAAAQIKAPGAGPGLVRRESWVDQNVRRRPAVGAMLVVWKKPLARPPVTCENITPP